MAVNLSMLAGAGAQFFDNNGDPLTGGKIYTYFAGTTTPVTTYTTNAGTVAHPNPIVLDAAGRVPSGGEIWLTDGISYKFIVRTSTEVLIGTYDNITNNIGNVYSALSAPDGSSLVGYQPLIGSATTVQARLREYEAGGGSALVGYQPAGTGAVATTVQTKLRETVSVFDYMTAAQIADVRAGTALIDVSAALNSAIAANAGKAAVYIPYGTYLVNSAITVPSSTAIYADPGATIKAGTNSMSVFTTSGFTTGILLSSIKVNGNGKTGVTAFNISNVQYNSRLEQLNVDSCANGIVLDNVCIGITVDTPTAFKTPNAIRIINNSNANTVLTPNLDNLTTNGGSGTGTGVYITGVTNQIVGGFIQGFQYAVYDAGQYNGITGLYVEVCTDSAVACQGASETYIENLFFFGYNPTPQPCYAVTATNSTGVKVVYPNMVQSNSTGGLYYFVNGNTQCTEIHTSNGTTNTALGTATQITPTGAATNQYTPSLVKNGTATTAVAFVPFTFNVASPNTVTLCEVTLMAQEQTGFVASATRKFVFALTNAAGTLTASAVASDAASSIDKTTANYSITVGTPTVSIVNATTANFNVTLTTGGAIGWTSCKYTVKAALTSTSTASVN